MYSIKKPTQRFWRTNVTREQALKELEESKIGADWLVCPVGVADKAITIAEFAANSDALAKQQTEPTKPTMESRLDIPRRNAPRDNGLKICVEGLTHSYSGGSAPAIRDLTFDVGTGEVFGFLGPSGAGKSTTLNILIGLLKGWQGGVQVLERPLAEWGSEYFRSIGVCFEAPNHYLKLTARENLEFFRSLYAGDAMGVEETLALVGLEKDIDKAVGEFSKGMKTRLNFARSLMHRPELWFLDEPTAGLDPVNAVKIREIIRQGQELGVTTIITTHDMTTAEIVCDRVAFIVDGQIAAIDSPDALRRRFGARDVELRWENASGDEKTDAEQFALEGLADNPAFLDALRRPGLSSMHSQEATLEDVFVQVTGRTLQ